MKSIFEYTNYRSFLKDFYEERKALDGYTYRDFSNACGMNSSSWLMHLIKGTKNLSKNTADRIAKALHFQKNETEFFHLLILFTQADNNQEKNLVYNKMIELKKKLHIIRISEEQYEYYTQWYHPVVRSLVSKVTWKEDYALLGRKLLPQITASQAKKSVLLLIKLGFIEKTASGAWKQKSDILSTGNEVMSLNIVNYHKQVTKLAENAFDVTPKEWRDISSLTLGINESDALTIKTKVQEFRKQIIEIARKSANADRVFQLNFQFFPVSTWEETDNE